uniref:Uncharacterized protein n=1 Tax=Setaria italica TaxID=4555 RepID=K3XN59_SETIT
MCPGGVVGAAATASVRSSAGHHGPAVLPTRCSLDASWTSRQPSRAPASDQTGGVPQTEEGRTFCSVSEGRHCNDQRGNEAAVGVDLVTKFTGPWDPGVRIGKHGKILRKYFYRVGTKMSPFSETGITFPE